LKGGASPLSEPQASAAGRRPPPGLLSSIVRPERAGHISPGRQPWGKALALSIVRIPARESRPFFTPCRFLYAFRMRQNMI